jgi:hypothetical protein
MAAESANGTDNRLADLTQQYIGEGRQCGGPCGQFKAWDQFNYQPNGKNMKKSICKGCQKQAVYDYRRGIKRPRPEQPETQTCKECREVYPLNAVHWHRHRANAWGYHTTCKTCANEVRRLVHNLEHGHPKQLAEGRCYACGKETDKLVLDHDHDTNEFRGWACRSCNRRLCAPYTKTSSANSAS